MKHSLFKCFAGLLLSASCSVAFSYPTKPVTIVVPAPPGGTADTVARSISARLTTALGQPVVIENKPGAGGVIASQYVAGAPADGYTLLMGAVHHTIAANVYKNLSYDFQKDFAPITVVGVLPNVLVVKSTLPVNSVAQLISLAKANPGQMTYGSSGIGSTQHLAGALFSKIAGISMNHVPYKG
ncbi:MAG: tripartite tricarboxylate transporter substrate-binding protein, partial [Burkholderiales bacterium]